MLKNNLSIWSHWPYLTNPETEILTFRQQMTTEENYFLNNCGDKLHSGKVIFNPRIGQPQPPTVREKGRRDGRLERDTYRERERENEEDQMEGQKEREGNVERLKRERKIKRLTRERYFENERERKKEGYRETRKG